MPHRARMRVKVRIAPAAVMASCTLWLAAALVFGAAMPARAAEESAGTRAAAFLVPIGSPTLLATGGAGVSGAFSSAGLQAAAVNAAALARTGPLQAYFAHALLGEAGAQDWAAVGGRVGASATRWALAATFRDEGTIDGRDAHDQPIGEVSASSLALGLQLARPIGERLALGAGTRVVSQGIGDSRGLGLAFDAGAQANLGALRLGVAARDFGGGMRWDGQHWRMPASLALGAGYTHARSGLALAADFVMPADYWRSLRAGAEWNYRNRLALRGGWRAELGADREEPLSGPAFGLGARAARAWVDYAMVMSGDGTYSHRFALSLRDAASAPFGPQPETHR